MTFANEGAGDRAARMLAGIVLLCAAWGGGIVSGAYGAVVLTIGALLLVTGIVGWCPAYSVFGISTRKVVEGHCPHCQPQQRV